MNNLNTILFLAATWLALFLQSYFNGFQSWFGAKIDLLPSLVLYASLTSGISAVTLVAVWSGLACDAISANPLGISVLPLFLSGWLIYGLREVLLTNQLYAQLLLGFLVGPVSFGLTILMLLTVGKDPLLGWYSLWQVTVVALGGALFTPVWFWGFNRLNRLLNYQPLAESSFRADRELKRGRA